MLHHRDGGDGPDNMSHIYVKHVGAACENKQREGGGSESGSRQECSVCVSRTCGAESLLVM